MTWQYKISTGELSHDGLHIGDGYSGHDVGRNNIAMVKVAGIGPCPPGRWVIGKAYPHGELGPITMNLDPLEETNTFGRSLFRIHGNNKINDASHGCIILGPAQRRAIAKSTDKMLEVVA